MDSVVPREVTEDLWPVEVGYALAVWGDVPERGTECWRALEADAVDGD